MRKQLVRSGFITAEEISDLENAYRDAFRLRQQVVVEA